jgi:tRNA A-37 threonylcarbamoyl transferase component Bud32
MTDADDAASAKEADFPPTFGGDRYAVARVLGEGGQATSYQAVDKREGRLVVVKRFRVRGAKSWKEVELAEREAKVLATVKHAALPRYVDHFEERGELFLVTEFIEGESLEAIRKRGGRLAVDDVVRFLETAASALGYLHGRAPAVIHRDIKPSNVLRRADGTFAIIDFGAVRDRMKPEGGSTVVGTFGYMGPEQFQGRAMPCSDVYAVGATALVLLTGIEPEDLPHKGLAIDVRAALAGTPAQPWLVDALVAMLDPDPDRRAASLAPLLERRRAARRDDAPRRKKSAREDDANPWPFREGARGGPRPDRSRERTRERRGDADRGRRVRGYGVPLELGGPIGWVVHIALLIAEVTVRFALRRVLAPAFDATSSIFGRPWRDAATTLRRADDEAQDEIARARAYTIGTRFRRPKPEKARVRIAEFEGDAEPARASAPAGEKVDAEIRAEAEAEAERAAAEPRRARRAGP